MSRGKFQTGVQFLNRGLTLGVNGGSPGEDANGFIPDGEWSHVVGVYEANVDTNTTELTVYVDGFLSGTRSRFTDNGTIFVPVPADNTFESIILGALSFEQPPPGDGPEDFIQFFSGSVDEVAYYDYALAADQVLDHYEAADVCVPDEPGFEFACDDGFDNDCDTATDADDSDCNLGVGPFLRGDCDGNGTVGGSPTEAIVLLNFAFRGGEPPGCLAACDAEANGSLGITDALRILRHSFLGIGEPDPPFPKCMRSELATDLGIGCEVPLCAN